MTEKRLRRGHIEFDQNTDRSFINLVTQTLSQSEHIATRRDRIPQRDADVLVLEEIVHGEVRVTLHPQVWDGGNVVTSDDTIEFLIPLDDATDSDGELYAERSREADNVKMHRNAPPSVCHYPGPYYITLERLDD